VSGCCGDCGAPLVGSSVGENTGCNSVDDGMFVATSSGGATGRNEVGAYDVGALVCSSSFFCDGFTVGSCDTLGHIDSGLDVTTVGSADKIEVGDANREGDGVSDPIGSKGVGRELGVRAVGVVVGLGFGVGSSTVGKKNSRTLLGSIDFCSPTGWFEGCGPSNLPLGEAVNSGGTSFFGIPPLEGAVVVSVSLGSSDFFIRSVGSLLGRNVLSSRAFGEAVSCAGGDGVGDLEASTGPVGEIEKGI